ncbi:MAG TPA: DUF1697 domain-containing protein [Caulobacteraceae bacterium]|nr:DUF1697 domain-containing protein [Caulobacteraceae bacterium]
MPTAIALLRAVNVGGRSVKMAALVSLAREMGFQNPRTLLQSGNLVFETAETADGALEARLEAAAQPRFGFPIDFICRTAAEWRELIAGNPFPDAAKADPARLLATLLKRSPPDGGMETLRAAIKGREQAALAGRTLYVVYPDGIGRSRLTGAVIERHLKGQGTARNWNTVLKLADMLD